MTTTTYTSKSVITASTSVTVTMAWTYQHPDLAATAFDSVYDRYGSTGFYYIDKHGYEVTIHGSIVPVSGKTNIAKKDAYAELDIYVRDWFNNYATQQPLVADEWIKNRKIALAKMAASEPVMDVNPPSVAKLTAEQINALRYLLAAELSGKPITTDVVHHALVCANEWLGHD